MACDEVIGNDRDDLSNYIIHWKHDISDIIDITLLAFCEIVGDNCVENIACEIVKVVGKG